MVKITIFWTFLLRLDLSSTQKLSKRALWHSCHHVLRFCKWSIMWSKKQALQASIFEALEGGVFTRIFLLVGMHRFGMTVPLLYMEHLGCSQFQ